MSYTGELMRAMDMLAQEPNSIFLGQGVGVPSTILTDTLRNVPEHKRIEFPVAEDLQMGMAIGMALDGWLPVCIYARWDFLLLAAGQLVLHLDSILEMSRGGYDPKVIIRVVSPSYEPFDPGTQHRNDHTEAFRKMLLMPVIRLRRENKIVSEYKRALNKTGSTILVEYGEYYDAIPSGVMG